MALKTGQLMARIIRLSHVTHGVVESFVVCVVSKSVVVVLLCV